MNQYTYFRLIKKQIQLNIEFSIPAHHFSYIKTNLSIERKKLRAVTSREPHAFSNAMSIGIKTFFITHINNFHEEKGIPYFL